MFVRGEGTEEKMLQFIAVSPEHSTLSMKRGIIQNKWIIRETSINDSIKLLSSQAASGGQHD